VRQDCDKDCSNDCDKDCSNDCDKDHNKNCDNDRLPMSNILYNIATILLYNVINREIKELLLFSIFIITRRYKIVEIRQ